MKSLNEDLKTGNFKQIYLLYGSEGYLKKQYKERFIKAMLPEGDTMNYAYYEGKGMPQDTTEAAHWFLKAAEQGNAKAQFYMGVCYYEGKGVPQDYAKA